jgi:LmbE family N-acetylglucosaminyl deacetylase
MHSLTDLGTVLALWAHPDDETYLSGGLLGELVAAGQRAVCVTATRGEAADPLAGPDERSALAALRTEELEAALAILGVTEHHWLDHPDGGCADLDPAVAVEPLVRLLDDVRPDTIVTFGPDGFTGHPDHRAVSAWADLAVRRSAADPRILHAVRQEEAVDAELDEEYGVFELGRPRVCADADLAFQLRLDGPGLERKVEALLSQVSQTGGLVAAVGRERFAAWIATESFALPAPPHGSDEGAGSPPR